ncbi:MAG: hypothetical protein NTY35_15695 [Planctomycetota bacterium]|nr:hypothetical protein [Planctomycetota bacterium]
MRLGKYAIPATLAFTALFAACSGSGSDQVSINSITAALQDLDTDPSGETTTITFASATGLGGATTANFLSEDGQTATSVVVTGTTATVVWDGRVTPSNRVRATGLGNVSESFVDVTTSDSSAPTFTSPSGTQTTGLGGDQITVTFSGPNVVEADVEDLDNWTLRIDGTTMDLSGSTFVLDEPSQVLTITLGGLANLHATFDLAASGVHGVNDATVSTTAVAGTATGDAVAPTLASVTQNLSEDEFGRVVDFTFDEAMDPVFATQISHFSVAAPATATSVEQPSENVLRVSFSAPIIPGQDTVDLAGIVDAHGNDFADATVAVTQPSPVANAYASTPTATTVADAGGDTVTVVTTQALDPTTAEDPAGWTLVVDGTPVDLSTQTLAYDLLSKTLTIGLSFDMNNGDAFTVTGASVLDVDGQSFTASSGGNVAGDASAPTLTSVTQNRNIDPSGKTLDVRFSEDVRETAAETASNYVDTGAMSIVTATLLTGLDTVRLVYDDVVVPGDVTLAIANIQDLAGNTITTVPSAAVISTDTTSPSVTGSNARALAGASNDSVAVVFNDDMVPSEILDPSNWAIESPVGNALTLAGTSVAYSTSTRVAILTLDNGVDLQRGDDFQVSFVNARDIGGNTVSTTTSGGSITAETVVPEVHSIYRESSVANELVVVFTEPCANVDDLYDATTNADGTRYDLRDSLGGFRGRPTSATVAENGLIVRLAFGFTVGATDTLDVYGCTDLCGNPLLPAFAVGTVAENTAQPSLSVGFSTVTAVTGENNDVIDVVFDRPMSPWNLTDAGRFQVTGPSGLLDLDFATFEFDGTSTVSIRLRASSGNDITTGANYSVAANEVFSAQGTQRTVADSESPIVALGDSTAPVVAASGVRLDPSDANSLLVTADETLSSAQSAVATNYDLNSGTLATSATRIGARVVRVTFPVAPTAGDTLDFTVSDLATNATGTITRVVTVADATPPLVTSVTGVIVPGYGGDYVDVAFDEPITNAALALPNWSLTSNGSPVSLVGSRITMIGTSSTVRLVLPPGSDLDSAGNVSVTLNTAVDFAGNAIVAPITLGGPVSGDSTPPAALQSFVNWRVDPTGSTIDVWFDEDVDASVAAFPASWSATGGVTVSAAEMLERDHYRLTLSASFSNSDTLSISNLRDPAKNASGTLTFDPAE